MSKQSSGDEKNSRPAADVPVKRPSLLSSPLEIRAFIAASFVLFLMFLTGLSSYAWGYTHALEAQAIQNDFSAPEQALFDTDAASFPVYERTGIVLVANKDFFLIRFLDAQNPVSVYTSPNTEYLFHQFISGGPETFEPMEAQKIAREEIPVGAHVQVHAEVDMRSANSFFATKIVKLP